MLLIVFTVEPLKTLVASIDVIAPTASVCILLSVTCSLSFTFQGTNYWVVGHTNRDQGYMQIELDGTIVATVNTQSTELVEYKIYYQGQTSDSTNHTLKFINLGTSDSAKTGRIAYVFINIIE